MHQGLIGKHVQCSHPARSIARLLSVPEWFPVPNSAPPAYVAACCASVLALRVLVLVRDMLQCPVESRYGALFQLLTSCTPTCNLCPAPSSPGLAASPWSAAYSSIITPQCPQSQVSILSVGDLLDLSVRRLAEEFDPLRSELPAASYPTSVTVLDSLSQTAMQRMTKRRCFEQYVCTRFNASLVPCIPSVKQSARLLCNCTLTTKPLAPCWLRAHLLGCPLRVRFGTPLGTGQCGKFTILTLPCLGRGLWHMMSCCTESTRRTTTCGLPACGGCSWRRVLSCSRLLLA